MSSYRKEPLTGQMHVYVSENHRFGTDAFLLANFSNWRKKDLVCDLGTGCGIIPMILQRKNPPKHTWGVDIQADACLLYTSPSPRDLSTSRMPSAA